MFNPTVVSNVLSRVENTSTLKYGCKVARFDPSVAEIFTRPLKSGGGFVPESTNHDWNFPVVQYPNGMPEGNAPVHVDFIREDRKDGKGKRNIIRIYKLSNKTEKLQTPLYRVTAAIARNAHKAKVLLPTCRFAVAGNAENADTEGGKFAGKSDYAFIAIAPGDVKVIAIAQMDDGETQTEILF